MTTRALDRAVDAEPGQTERPRATRKKSARSSGQKWTRRLHSWLSMTSLLVVLFFALTGITLNHPTWFGASTPQTRTSTGTLPTTTITNGVPARWRSASICAPTPR